MRIRIRHSLRNTGNNRDRWKLTQLSVTICVMITTLFFTTSGTHCADEIAQSWWQALARTCFLGYSESVSSHVVVRNAFFFWQFSLSKRFSAYNDRLGPAFYGEISTNRTAHRAEATIFQRATTNSTTLSLKISLSEVFIMK